MRSRLMTESQREDMNWFNTCFRLQGRPWPPLNSLFLQQSFQEPNHRALRNLTRPVKDHKQQCHVTADLVVRIE